MGINPQTDHGGGQDGLGARFLAPPVLLPGIRVPPVLTLRTKKTSTGAAQVHEWNAGGARVRRRTGMGGAQAHRKGGEGGRKPVRVVVQREHGSAGGSAWGGQKSAEGARGRLKSAEGMNPEGREVRLQPRDFSGGRGAVGGREPG